MSEMRSKSHQAINRLDLGLKSRVTLEMSCRLRDDLDSGTLEQDLVLGLFKHWGPQVPRNFHKT